MAEVAARSDQLAGGMLGRLKVATLSSRSRSTSDASNLQDVTEVGEATEDTAQLPWAFAHRWPDCSPAEPVSCGKPFLLQASGGGLGL
mmetsp:Transcript_155667/g.499139  ORF Transcript_155667/g.499139 Transcript_155667/m.499139 type:complete len:88 (+) Transcript_155667:2-265(+)